MIMMMIMILMMVMMAMRDNDDVDDGDDDESGDNEDVLSFIARPVLAWVNSLMLSDPHLYLGPLEASCITSLFYLGLCLCAAWY